MKKKLSVRDEVSRLIKTNGAMSPIELINQIDRPRAQVYTAISKLKAYGYLTRQSDGKYVLADPLGKQVEEKNLVNRLAAARAEVDNLQKQLQDMTIKYYDTLAVSKYLESKLNIAKRL